MAMEEKITDLRALVDDHFKSFYFSISGKPHLRLDIFRISETQFIVIPPKNVPFSGKVSGFVVGKGGGAIYCLEGEVGEALKDPEALFDLVTVTVDMDTIRMENRREFFRVKFAETFSAHIVKKETKEESAVSVLDVSGGGMRIRSHLLLKAGDVLRVSFNPLLDEIAYKFDLLMEVRLELSSVDHSPESKDVYGLMMIMPKYANSKEIAHFDMMQRQMIKFCNDYLAYLKKLDLRAIAQKIAAPKKYSLEEPVSESQPSPKS